MCPLSVRVGVRGIMRESSLEKIIVVADGVPGTSDLQLECASYWPVSIGEITFSSELWNKMRMGVTKKTHISLAIKMSVELVVLPSKRVGFGQGHVS